MQIPIVYRSNTLNYNDESDLSLVEETLGSFKRIKIVCVYLYSRRGSLKPNSSKLKNLGQAT
jgi:hypothetical protein